LWNNALTTFYPYTFKFGGVIHITVVWQASTCIEYFLVRGPPLHEPRLARVGCLTFSSESSIRKVI
jgi:hypothetical protein